MAVAELKNVKVVLKLSKGSQTISGCNSEASDTQLYNLGSAVGTLESEAVETISKIEESILINA